MVTPDSVRNALPASPQSRDETSTCKVAYDWDFDVERGPNWLFVTVNGGDADVSELPPLADRLRSLLEQHLTNRVVLELGRGHIPYGRFVRQLELLDQWVCDHNGVIRLCGLPAHYADVLRRCGLGARFPIYGNRREAVFGSYQPGQPR